MRIVRTFHPVGQGADRDVLKLRPWITGPATLMYRLEDEYLANARTLVQGV